jgi:hypothetical protein
MSATPVRESLGVAIGRLFTIIVARYGVCSWSIAHDVALEN